MSFILVLTFIKKCNSNLLDLLFQRVQKLNQILGNFQILAHDCMDTNHQDETVSFIRCESISMML